MQQYGFTKNIFIYPIYPMKGVEVNCLKISDNHIENEKQYIFEDEHTERYSWMNQSQLQELKSYQPYIDKQGKITVSVGDRDSYDINDDRLLAFLVGQYNHIFTLVTSESSEPAQLKITALLGHFSEEKIRSIIQEERPHICLQKKSANMVISQGSQIRIGSYINCLVHDVHKPNESLENIFAYPQHSGIIQVGDIVYALV